MIELRVDGRKGLLIAPTITMCLVTSLAGVYLLDSGPKPDMMEAFAPVAIGLVAAPGYVVGCLGSSGLLVGAMKKWAILSAWLGIAASLIGVVLGAFTIILAVLSAASGVSAFQLVQALKGLGSSHGSHEGGASDAEA